MRCEIGGEIFVRSIAGIDTEAEVITFYCDIAPGDELLGVNINQTLVALAFFSDVDHSYEDDLIDNFPIHYASFLSISRAENLIRLRC